MIFFSEVTNRHTAIEHFSNAHYGVAESKKHTPVPSVSSVRANKILN